MKNLLLTLICLFAVACGNGCAQAPAPVPPTPVFDAGPPPDPAPTPTPPDPPPAPPVVVDAGPAPVVDPDVLAACQNVDKICGVQDAGVACVVALPRLELVTVVSLPCLKKAASKSAVRACKGVSCK